MEKILFCHWLAAKDMLDLAFQSWQPWWISEEEKAKSENLKELCFLGKKKHSDMGPSSLRGAIISDTVGTPLPGSPYLRYDTHAPKSAVL